MKPIQGIHHITAIAGNAQKNIDFYRNVLGQRLVKRTVNFDDPGTYHFYYGDEIGTPGTILTFFPWRHMPRGRRGSGEVGATAYTIGSGSFDYWAGRLAEHSIRAREDVRFGARVLSFEDPDGMAIELIASDERATIRPWTDGPIASEHALRGFHSATLWVARTKETAELLTDQMGYVLVGQEGACSRYRGASGDIGLYVDLLERPNLPPGRMGSGSVHHIAFRTVDDAEQLEYQAHLRTGGQRVTQVMDRQYFRSIYFRSPGGVLFEVATDAPGFLYDEPVDELGTHLKLPAWLEPQREQIEEMVPPITLSPLASPS